MTPTTEWIGKPSDAAASLKEGPVIDVIASGNEKILAFKMSGKLHDEDYKKFVPLLEEAVQKLGKIRLLSQFHDFNGWDMHALWDDIKVATKYCTHIERIALVGEKKWEKWMAGVCKPFTMATVKYFDAAEIDSAWKWLREGV
jgi:hypothetical protein